MPRPRSSATTRTVPEKDPSARANDPPSEMPPTATTPPPASSTMRRSILGSGLWVANLLAISTGVTIAGRA